MGFLLRGAVLGVWGVLGFFLGVVDRRAGVLFCVVLGSFLSIFN